MRSHGPAFFLLLLCASENRARSSTWSLPGFAHQPLPTHHFSFCGHLLSLCGWWKGCYFGLPPPPLNRGKSFGGHPGQTQLASKLDHSGARGLHAMSVIDPRLMWPCSQQVHLGRTWLWSPGWSSESSFQASAMGRGLCSLHFCGHVARLAPRRRAVRGYRWGHTNGVAESLVSYFTGRIQTQHNCLWLSLFIF